MKHLPRALIATFVASALLAMLSVARDERPEPLRVLLVRHAETAESTSTARDPELGDLAGILQRTLLRLRRALGGPSYRYTLVTAPEDAGADVGSFHWHLVVRPVLGVPSALGGLIDYNPVAPERACARLTKVEL